MFSNELIKSKCPTSDERNLKLSKEDWDIVLNANKDFSENEDDFRGYPLWGRYLVSKIGRYAQCLSEPASLELCCGHGFLFFSFRDVVKGYGRGAFIDISEDQCKSFRARCHEIGLKNIDIRCGDIGQLPFADNSMQLVYGNSFLHHLPDVKKYLAEANRVLRKGGKLIVFHEPSLTASFWESFPLSLFKDTRVNSLTDIWVISPSVIEELLYKTGFNVVKILPQELIASLIVTPLQIIMGKISRRHASSNFFVRLKMLCSYIDLLLPMKFRLKYSPSLAIYAEK